MVADSGEGWDDLQDGAQCISMSTISFLAFFSNSILFIFFTTFGSFWNIYGQIYIFLFSIIMDMRSKFTLEKHKMVKNGHFRQFLVILG